GDFNGDNKGDILWHNTTTGQVVIWLTDGTNVIGGGSPGTVPIGWFIWDTGDFNGDGKRDILWQNSTGQVVVWLMDGASVIRGGGPGRAATPPRRRGGGGGLEGRPQEGKHREQDRAPAVYTEPS